ncbi:hypothetical protein BZG36_05206 [Bifiguratus adelaidae]|uniref:Mid2 domain-containing protein n=1 Tax=Bifiguratus adelaidae TaxID=1938954 RepID=A0A261XTH0_9FUNG|nr:hypothetical protein BZG36_05206 [Bifiguratus adelaidae]
MPLPKPPVLLGFFLTSTAVVSAQNPVLSFLSSVFITPDPTTRSTATATDIPSPTDTYSSTTDTSSTSLTSSSSTSSTPTSTSDSTSSSSSITSSSPTSISSFSSTPLSSGVQSSSNAAIGRGGGGQLSTGAIVGIAIAGVFVFALLALFLFCCLRRRDKSLSKKYPKMDPAFDNGVAGQYPMAEEPALAAAGYNDYDSYNNYNNYSEYYDSAALGEPRSGLGTVPGVAAGTAGLAGLTAMHHYGQAGTEDTYSESEYGPNYNWSNPGERRTAGYYQDLYANRRQTPTNTYHQSRFGDSNKFYHIPSEAVGGPNANGTSEQSGYGPDASTGGTPLGSSAHPPPVSYNNAPHDAPYSTQTTPANTNNTSGSSDPANYHTPPQGYGDSPTVSLGGSTGRGVHPNPAMDGNKPNAYEL